jgi:hypothetical protein
MRWLLGFTGVVLLIVLMASGSAGGTSATRSATLHFVENQLGSNFIDNPPKQGPHAAPLMGDMSADTSRLQTSSGATVGHLETTCVATRGGPKGDAICTSIYSLKGGMVTGVARVRFSSPTVVVAITGGTGAYEGVSGSGDAKRRSGAPLADDTLHLIWP